MRRTRIDEVTESQLVDMAEPLERPRIQDLTLITIQPNENVDRVTDLVMELRHRHLKHRYHKLVHTTARS